MPNSVTQPYLILGEGKRDRLFFEKICASTGVAHFQCEGAEGFGTFHKSLKGAWAARTGFDKLRGLVIVGDNDPNGGKTFASIKQQLQDVGLAAPAEPFQVATKTDSPPVVVIMMPYFGIGNVPVGALESILIPVIDRVHPNEANCFTHMFNCVGADKWNSESSKAKLRVRCILSSASPDNPMCGVEVWFGGSANLIPFNDPTFDGVKDLLLKLPTWIDSGVPKWADWRQANP